MTKKIALFGGTFNPIHQGHLINAQYLVNECDIDSVLFIPAREPVHKTLEYEVSSSDRLRMIELAIAGNPAFDVSRIELDSELPSYTVITLERIRGLYQNDSVFLVIGADSYNQLSSWREYRKILQLAPVIVFRRPGDEIDRELYNAEGGNFLFAENPLVGISSRAIRELISTGKSISYLLPDAVRDYIVQKELYKT